MAQYGASIHLVNRLEKDLTKKEAELENVESERDALVKRLEELQVKSGSELKENKVACAAQLAKARADADDVAKSLRQELWKAHDLIKTTLSDHAASKQELGEDAKYKTIALTLDKKLKSLQGEFKGCQNARDFLTKELGDACKARKQQEERLNSLISELELCQSDKAALLEEKLRAREIREEQEERLKEERKGFQDSLGALQEEKNRAWEQTTALQSTIQNQTATIQKLGEACSELRSNVKRRKISARFPSASRISDEQ